MFCAFTKSSYGNTCTNDMVNFSKDKCKTTEIGKVGPMLGVACIFPFIYEGTSYNGCIPDSGSCYWCSTKINDEGVHISGEGFWGCCNDVCPKDNEKGMLISIL